MFTTWTNCSNRLDGSGLKIPKYVRQADELTPFAVVTRYPGLVGPVTKRQHRHAVRIAAAVLRWAERRLDSHDSQGMQAAGRGGLPDCYCLETLCARSRFATAIPSTLHLWWARRPLAACRSMLMALLLPDPGDQHCPAEFKTTARSVLGKMTGKIGKRMLNCDPPFFTSSETSPTGITHRTAHSWRSLVGW